MDTMKMVYHCHLICEQLCKIVWNCAYQMQWKVKASSEKQCVNSNYVPYCKIQHQVRKSWHKNVPQSESLTISAWMLTQFSKLTFTSCNNNANLFLCSKTKKNHGAESGMPSCLRLVIDCNFAMYYKWKSFWNSS